ncbi:tRNA (N6-threonylcarbamoyladenosine(37)-N6)-methyltransferase TrmO [Desulfotalea psychrophila]|nr:tRNA (N6-threonylcarbamoyladenosine(37)-N6)-methyltransferase TrmO [Desulfotalea psychrophila]
MTKFEIEPIGIVHSCFSEKFGIPRQPGLVHSSVAELELLPPWNRQELVAGLSEFTHIWVHFVFHKTIEAGWRESIRPPGLGGKKRVGVFASRSPHRPNHMGMSVVRLRGIRASKGKVFLQLSGIDLLDGTPVVDIKPYVAYSDSIPEASSSYAGSFFPVRVRLRGDVLSFCEKYQDESGRDLAELIREVLAQDPRPVSQRGKRDVFGVLLWQVNVRFRVVLEEGEEIFEVFSCVNL